MMVLVVDDVVIIQRFQVIFSQCWVVVVLERWKRILLFHQFRHGVLVNFSSGASCTAAMCARRACASVRSSTLSTTRAPHRSSLYTSWRHRFRAQ